MSKMCVLHYTLCCIGNLFKFFYMAMCYLKTLRIPQCYRKYSYYFLIKQKWAIEIDFPPLQRVAFEG